MAILGVAEISFGVDDLDRCAQFWDDFGLVPVARAADHAVFEVASGARVIVRRRADPILPPESAHTDLPTPSPPLPAPKPKANAANPSHSDPPSPQNSPNTTTTSPQSAGPHP